MQHIAVKVTAQHQMVRVGPYVDALTGEEWELYQCGECDEFWKLQQEPWKLITVCRGDSTVSHASFTMPDEDTLREMARRQGKLPEFEAAVDQAIIEGKPLLSFGMGGAKASTWPKGTGPVK